MPVVDISANAEGFRADPYPFYARLRAAGPVHRIAAPSPEYEPCWLVVGYEEGRLALNRPGLSKDWRGSDLFATGLATAVNANMLESDPPQHTRLRRLVAREFTARRVEALRPRVERITHDLLDAMAARPERSADLIEALAFPLPMTVICELLGVPDLDRARFSHWSSEVVAPTSSAPDNTAHRELGAYLAELVEAKSKSPGEDLLGALIRTRDEDGDSLSPDELIGMAFLLLVAGHETTVNLISNGVRALFAHPAQLADLRADYDGLLGGAVEEMLRYDGPVQNATFRYAREDVEIAGTAIPAGATVMVCLAAADRDPGRFPEPDRFDIRRAPQGHLAFGHGLHFCIGAPLARMEGRIAIRALLERFPDLAEDPAGGPPLWLPGSLMRGVSRLPVRW
ncbi:MULTISPECIES: cytochrome P450 [unclassified Streptomyces]|uniref:cytochrome P450 family protein n=1 Tax=unclassified Streptomyces TaxID=2593676 RepID=UPI00225B57E8|nr:MULTISPECIES: cytochrome P450 [unclassified Streptomyces]MCX4528844.1 cytochrome P450 [Streptomyces sp. NBC_01551]MCX4540548.1 cytochrome P450 [Streptomyces sp. NBC_01565]